MHYFTFASKGNGHPMMKIDKNEHLPVYLRIAWHERFRTAAQRQALASDVPEEIDTEALRFRSLSHMKDICDSDMYNVSLLSDNSMNTTSQWFNFDCYHLQMLL